LVDFAEGAVIFREGDPAGPAYLIESGSVRISRKGPDGEIILGDVHKGHLFGEMALVDSSPRMATATALTATSCSTHSQAQMQRKLQLLGPLPLAFYDQMIVYIRETLPWEARPPLERAQGATSADRAAREMVKRLPDVIAKIDHPPPMILELLDMFRDYIERRLPPY
jgi:CRP/FNR family cyclic AMP-dependent transcriptional regulator